MLAIVPDRGTMFDMEYANAEIRLAGSLENTVVKTVSAPEIAILRAIHGFDSVVNVTKSHTDDISQKAERERLSYTYGSAVVEKLFPGAIGKIATNLSEVGCAVEEPVKKAKA